MAYMEGMEKRLTLNAINRALAERGHAEKLVRGRGYFYFTGGAASEWNRSGVYVYHLNSYTLAEWLAERDNLAKDR